MRQQDNTDSVYTSSSFYQRDIYNYSADLGNRGDRLPDLEDEKGNVWPRERAADLYASATSDEFYVPSTGVPQGMSYNEADGTVGYGNSSTQAKEEADYLCDQHYVRCYQCDLGNDEDCSADQFGTYEGKEYRLCGMQGAVGDEDEEGRWGNNQCFSLSSFGTLDSCANAELPVSTSSDGEMYGPEMCLQSYATGVMSSQMTYQEQDIQQCWCKQELNRVYSNFPYTEWIEQLQAFVCVGGPGEFFPWVCNPEENHGPKMCYLMVKSMLVANALAVAVAIILALINIILKPLLIKLAKSEHNLSVTDERKAVVTSFFMFQ